MGTMCEVTRGLEGGRLLPDDSYLSLVSLVSCILKFLGLTLAGIQGDQAASKKWKFLLSSACLVKMLTKTNIKITFISHAVRNLLQLKTEF